VKDAPVGDVPVLIYIPDVSPAIRKGEGLHSCMWDNSEFSTYILVDGGCSSVAGVSFNSSTAGHVPSPVTGEESSHLLRPKVEVVERVLLAIVEVMLTNPVP